MGIKGKAISITGIVHEPRYQTADMIGQHMLLNDVGISSGQGLRTTLDHTETINAANPAAKCRMSPASRGKIVLEGW